MQQQSEQRPPLITDTVVAVLVTAVLNGAVTWGVVSTKLEWLRRDVDEARAVATEALRLVRLQMSPPSTRNTP